MLEKYLVSSGCGQKINSQELKEILNQLNFYNEDNAINSLDDASIYDINNGYYLLSSLDFFSPMISDPYLFGKISSINAISDIYAMGGYPTTALAILGLPKNSNYVEIAKKIMQGSIRACNEIGLKIMGGHSIFLDKPIFGLSVNGLVLKENIKYNNKAQIGDKIYITKPIGNGIMLNAYRNKTINEYDYKNLIENMCKINNIGSDLSAIEGLNSLTDITGFGLLGHLFEICNYSNVSAVINYSKIPLLPNLSNYINSNCSLINKKIVEYNVKLNKINNREKVILFDPQTSGGLLFTISKKDEYLLENIFIKHKLNPTCIGIITPYNKNKTIEVNL